MSTGYSDPAYFTRFFPLLLASYMRRSTILIISSIDAGALLTSSSALRPKIPQCCLTTVLFRFLFATALRHRSILPGQPGNVLPLTTHFLRRFRRRLPYGRIFCNRTVPGKDGSPGMYGRRLNIPGWYTQGRQTGSSRHANLAYI